MAHFCRLSEQLREKEKQLRKTTRDVERDRRGLEREEQKVMAEIKKAAKANLRRWISEQTDEAIAIAQCREALKCTIEARSAAVKRAESIQSEIDLALKAGGGGCSLRRRRVLFMRSRYRGFSEQ